jgi:hypothetical protein
MQKIWLHKADSFKSAEKFDEEYYLNMSSVQRLETMQFLREMYSKIKKVKKYESRKRLRRHIKVIQQT